MIYKDYKGYSKTYVLVHNTGFGVMEAPYIQHDVVYETNSYDDAKKKVLELELENNTAEEVKSSWCNNTYHINVNTLSKGGKILYKKFSDEFDEKLKKVKENYKETKIGGITFYSPKT